ncbi:NAD(+) diphosphatase [Psychrobacter sp. AOP22-C1-22]|uniref:NAD(+) diphosphatase n=1 Tax=unclassified Psychrobacter TaxID=196806 RepID=UPI0017887D50|nr:NAD(+) diphosphatase [Psychrobacter sp. FME6]MBE0407370.1 NAD(+) diphosphatase [Psychrobacter sp. FME6]MDN5801923.1 NAD(+) diphosphatase [Psychrobacter sp.]
MTNAFVFSDDTILCRQTSDGWWPLQVQLSPSNANTSHSEYQQAYQLGHVALLESLAPSHWLSAQDGADKNGKDGKNGKNTGKSIETDDTFTAPAASAITYDYAITNEIALPIIAESSGKAFVPYRQLITQLPVAVSDQLSQAMQLLRWQADTQFCSRCATPTVHAKQNERSMVCPACRLRQYPRVQPCVITAITRPNPHTGEMQILLAHHHRYGQQKTPQQTLQYGLIAGFVEVGESLEHAVVREVAEEVNISLTDIRYVSSQPWPFPSNLMLGFRAAYAGGELIIQEDELSHADFFDLSNLPKIPSKGSIAYELIAQIMNEQGMTI